MFAYVRLGWNLLYGGELIDRLQQVCRRRDHHAPGRVHRPAEQQGTDGVRFAEEREWLQENLDRKRLWRPSLITGNLVSLLFVWEGALGSRSKNRP